MKLKDLRDILMLQNPFHFVGNCCDCGRDVIVEATQNGEDTIISGGAVFHPPHDWHYAVNEYLFKCAACFETDPVFHPRTEIYSRVVGFLSPVKQWNNGKQAEWNTRKTFDIESLKEELDPIYS